MRFWQIFAKYWFLESFLENVRKGSNASGRFKQCAVFAKVLNMFAKMFTKNEN